MFIKCAFKLPVENYEKDESNKHVYSLQQHIRHKFYPIRSQQMVTN
jgi:hypothetical protein